MYFGEDSEICSGREINPMGRFEFCHVGCPVAVVWQSQGRKATKKRVYKKGESVQLYQSKAIIWKM